MKIELNKDKLIEAINTTEKFTGKHITLPILSQILFTFKENECVLRSTNLDVGIEYSIFLKNNNSFCEFAVSPTALKSFLTNINEKEVVFDFDNNILKVSSRNAEVSLPTQPSEDFPNVPKLDEEGVVSLPAGVFKEGVSSVSYSSSVSTIKPELSSIFIYPDQEELVFVATDSFRLAEKRVKIQKKNLKESVLIPFKNAVEIAKVFDGFTGNIDIISTKNQIVFKTDDVYVSSRAVDGVFPDYKQIIPKEFSSEVLVLKEDLLKTMKLTSGFLDKFQQVIFSFNPLQKKLIIKTKGNVDGEVNQTLSVTGSGEEIIITFNHKYIVDCLQSIKSEQVLFRLLGNNKPVIITEVSQKSFTYLVMPMNR